MSKKLKWLKIDFNALILKNIEISMNIWLLCKKMLQWYYKYYNYVTNKIRSFTFCNFWYIFLIEMFCIRTRYDKFLSEKMLELSLKKGSVTYEKDRRSEYEYNNSFNTTYYKR